MISFNKGKRAPHPLEVKWARFQFKTSSVQRAKFYENVASLVRDGQPFDVVLKLMQARMVSNGRPFGYVIGRWVNVMKEGRPFSDAIKGTAPNTEAIILAAGEESGDFAGALEQAAMVAMSGHQLVKTMRTALTMPMIQLVILAVVMIGFSSKVAPTLERSAPLWAMQPSHRSFFEFAGQVREWWFIAVPIILAVLFAMLASMPIYAGKFRKYLDKLPPWSIYRVYSSSTFMISLAALIRAGKPIEASIRFIRANSSPWLRSHLTEMISRLNLGQDQGDSLDVGLFSDDLADSVAIYAKSSSFDQSMKSIAAAALKTAIEDIEGKSAFAKTMSTILLGVTIGWMFDATMGIGDAAKKAQDMRGQQTQVTR
ncbi:MAG: type II secretion system F family protein [Polaromonas sp.]|nr:type II secretion system F family protein [Polaromonas sp.]